MYSVDVRIAAHANAGKTEGAFRGLACRGEEAGDAALQGRHRRAALHPGDRRGCETRLNGMGRGPSGGSTTLRTPQMSAANGSRVSAHPSTTDGRSHPGVEGLFSVKAARGS